MSRSKTTVGYSYSYSKFTKEEFEKYLGLLPDKMKDDIREFKQWKDANLSLMGKLLLMEGLQSIDQDPGLIHQIMYSSFGKPYLPSTLNFNLSHSGNLVVCVVSDGQTVGVDLEKIKPVDIRQFYKQLNASEKEEIVASSDPVSTFFCLWTKKEAILKAQGCGLNWPMREIQFLNLLEARLGNDHWFLTELNLDSEYACHVASNLPGFHPIEVKKYEFGSRHSMVIVK